MAGVAWHGGGMHGRGDIHGRGRACMVGGGMYGRRDGCCSGRYASYWNAFLSSNKFSSNTRNKRKSVDFAKYISLVEFLNQKMPYPR